MIFGFAAEGAVATDSAKIVGPNACAECHKQEAEAWKGTHHFKTFREMPRNTEANEIAEKMGVRRIKSESLCLNCHFTVQQKNNKEEPVAGISCESCHGAGKDWIKVHSGFSGKKENTETKAEEEARWKLAEFQGDDQAALDLPAGEELLWLPCRAARGSREQRRPSGRQRLRAGVLVAGRGAAQYLVFQGQGKRAGQRGAQADALSRRPRRRA